MASPDDDDFLAPRLRTMQIIVAAQTAGALIFLAIAVFLRSQDGRVNRADQTMLTYVVGFPFVLAILAAQFVVPRFVTANGRRMIVRGTFPANVRPPAQPPGDLERLCGLYQTQLIVGAAMLEGATFYMIVAYLTEGTAPALVIAVLLIVGLTLRFPTRDRFERWLAVQGELLVRERQEG
jgi:hypothetical protein